MGEVRFGQYRYDADTGVLYREREVVQLPPRAAAVLGCLIAAGGDGVAKDRILATAWPDSFVAEDSLTQAISVLRSALGDDPRHPRFIQTVPRRGYRFLAEVPVSADARVAEPAGGVGWRTRAATVAGAAILLAGGLLWAGIFDEGTLPDGQPGYDRIRRLELVIDAEAPNGADDSGFAHDGSDLRAVLVDRIERETRLAVVDPGDQAEAALRVELRREADRLKVRARVHGRRDGADWWGQDWNLPTSMYSPESLARSLLSRLAFLLDLAAADSTLRGTDNREAMLLGVRASDLLLGPAQRDLREAQEASSALGRALELDPGAPAARPSGSRRPGGGR